MADSVFAKVEENVKKTADKYGLKLLSIVLYGSRARGDGSNNSDYDFLVLIGDDTNLLDFTQFNAELRAKLHRNSNVEIFSNTLENFKKILYNNPFLGAFCYIIASEGRPLYDPENIFKKIQEEIRALPVKKKIEYAEKCLEMSRKMNYPKWIRFWNKSLKTLREKLSLKSFKFNTQLN